MSRAAIGIYGEELYEQVLPLHGPDPDGLAHDYIGALTSQAIEIDDLARDDAQGRPGWGAILDVDACPVKGLPWLAQIAGVSLRDPKVLNYVANLFWFPSFESGLFQPFGSGAGISVTRVLGGTTAYGRAYGRITLTASTANAKVVSQYGALPGALKQPVVGGHTYTAAMDVLAFAVATGGVTLRLQWFGPDTYSPANSTITGLGRASVTGVAPATATTMEVQLIVPTPTIGDVFDIDAISLVDGTSTVYVDGDQAGYAWEGDPHASPTRINRLETPEEWAAYARDAIRRQGGKGRGTPDAILSAAEDTLTGAKIGRLLERVGGNAYALELVTRPSETPSPAATLAAAMAQKPAGMNLTHTLTEGIIINEGTRTIDTSTGTIDAATIGDVT